MLSLTFPLLYQLVTRPRNVFSPDLSCMPSVSSFLLWNCQLHSHDHVNNTHEIGRLQWASFCMAVYIHSGWGADSTPKGERYSYSAHIVPMLFFLYCREYIFYDKITQAFVWNITLWKYIGIIMSNKYLMALSSCFYEERKFCQTSSLEWWLVQFGEIPVFSQHKNHMFD